MDSARFSQYCVGCLVGHIYMELSMVFTQQPNWLSVGHVS